MLCMLERKLEGAQLMRPRQVLVAYVFILSHWKEDAMNYDWYIVEALPHPDVFMLQY